MAPTPPADRFPSTVLRGRWGEDSAVEFLLDRGWTLMHRNYRAGRDEIDLIVRRADLIAFVEVKSRGGTRYGDPSHAVDREKRRRVARAAAAWIREHPVRGSVAYRFDVVTVQWRRHPPVVEHYPDAWRIGM